MKLDLTGKRKTWRPALLAKAERQAAEAHNKIISRQVMKLFNEQIRDDVAVYRVRIPLGVGRGDRGKLTQAHVNKAANWVRRRGGLLRRERIAFGAGCIVPRLQTWGVVFSPRIELDLVLLVCLPLDRAAASANRLQEVFGGKIKLVRKGGKLGDVIWELRNGLEYPDLHLGGVHVASDLSEHDRRQVLAITKNFRHLVRNVGVRRFWVFFGMRCDGNLLRRLTVTENEKHARSVKAREREARMEAMERS
jgi:hypothetical protein